MALEWIIMQHDLPGKPKTKKIGRLTGTSDPALTLGRLLLVWIWADKQSEDGIIHGVELADVDDEAGCEGFGEAMIQVGWLVKDGDTLSFPRFGDHNGQTAKTRAKESLKKQRQRRSRGTDRGQVSPKCPPKSGQVGDGSGTIQNKTKQNTDQENAARSCLDGETPPRPAKPNRAENRASPVVWDGRDGFQVCAFRRSQWAKAYPLVDIQHELDKAHAWYTDNPSRRKTHHAKFLGNWLSRAQEHAKQDARAGPRTTRLNDQFSITPDDPDDSPLAKLRRESQLRERAWTQSPPHSP